MSDESKAQIKAKVEEAIVQWHRQNERARGYREHDIADAQEAAAAGLALTKLPAAVWYELGERNEEARQVLEQKILARNLRIQMGMAEVIVAVDTDIDADGEVLQHAEPILTISRQWLERPES